MHSFFYGGRWAGRRFAGPAVAGASMGRLAAFSLLELRSALDSAPLHLVHGLRPMRKGRGYGALMQAWGGLRGFFPSGTPQCTRFRSAPSRSRASPYAKRKGVWRPHASMGRHTPFLFAHCSLPARTLYQQFFDLYSPKAGGRGDFYRQILRLVRKLEDVSCRFVSFILCRGGLCPSAEGFFRLSCTFVSDFLVCPEWTF